MFKKMGKYLVRSIRSARKDLKTKEILEYTDRTEIMKEDAEPFFLTYSKQIMALYGKSIFNATTKVLWKFLEFAEYNTGKVYITTERKDEILNTCNIKKTSYHRAINELVEEGLLSKNKNTFTLNHNMFWKGDKKVRDALIKDAKLKVAFTPVFKEADEKDWQELQGKVDQA